MKKYLPAGIIHQVSCFLILCGLFVLGVPVPGVAQSVITDIRNALERDSLGDYSSEIQVLNRVIQQQPAMARAWQLRGKAKYQSTDYSGAIADLHRAALLQPGNEEVYMLSAYARMALKQYKAAVIDFTKAIVINPSNSITWYHRGFTRQKLRQPKQARMDFRSANELGLKDARDILTESEPE